MHYRDKDLPMTRREKSKGYLVQESKRGLFAGREAMKEGNYGCVVALVPLAGAALTLLYAAHRYVPII